MRGCASQVWLVSDRRPETPDLLYFRGDSDAHLVRGEIALLLRISDHARRPVPVLDPQESSSADEEPTQVVRLS